MVAVIAAPLVVGCTPAAPTNDGESSATAGDITQPLVPTVGDTSPTREPASQLPAVPVDGTVTVEDGAFTDRLNITKVALRQGQRPTVTAELSNVVDVSELIVLQVQADFYDSTGRYLSSGSATYADQEFANSGVTPLRHGTGEHGETLSVSVRSDTPAQTARSAILTVPQLVNE